MPRSEVRFSGFGGQGIILAGNVVGRAALLEGKHATLTQSYGPESRGGASAAMVVLSDEQILYPKVTEPGVEVLMAQEAYDKYVQDIKDDGVILYDEDLVDPTTQETKARRFAIPATRLAEREVGHTIFANAVMLGAFAAASGLISAEALKQSLLSSVKKGTEDKNAKAFDLGYEHYQNLSAPSVASAAH